MTTIILFHFLYLPRVTCVTWHNSLLVYLVQSPDDLVVCPIFTTVAKTRGLNPHSSLSWDSWGKLSEKSALFVLALIRLLF